MSSGGYHPDYAPPVRARVYILPAATVIAGSLLTAWPAIVSAPLLPPLGLMMLLGWRLLRHDVWPVWAGLPLGLIDDLYSGHPVGTAVFSWTVILITLSLLDMRVVWRSWWLEWLIGAAALTSALIVGGLLARVGGLAALLPMIAPQILLSVALLPLFMQLAALLDRWRLR
ncbi:MAG: rod shape-determining protein MreD [Sphingomonas sp.]